MHLHEMTELCIAPFLAEPQQPRFYGIISAKGQLIWRVVEN